MIHIEFKIPTITLTLDKTDIVNFLEMALYQYTYNSANTIHDLSAIWLFNKLRNKTTQKTTTIKIPLEYAMLLKTYCNKYAKPNHDLHRIATDNIYIQLDKQLK